MARGLSRMVGSGGARRMTTLISRKEAAARLNISLRSLDYKIASGEIRVVHPTPGRTCIADSEIEAHIASLRKKVA